MLSGWRKIRTEVPAPFLAALLLSAGFLAFVGWDQSHWWRVKEDYSFGWLVPLFVIFVVHDRWRTTISAVQACGAAGSLRARGWRNGLLWLAIATALGFGILL